MVYPNRSAILKSHLVLLNFPKKLPSFCTPCWDLPSYAKSRATTQKHRVIVGIAELRKNEKALDWHLRMRKPTGVSICSVVVDKKPEEVPMLLLSALS